MDYALEQRPVREEDLSAPQVEERPFRAASRGEKQSGLQPPCTASDTPARAEFRAIITTVPRADNFL
jgi:hypothetical protein